MEENGSYTLELIDDDFGRPLVISDVDGREVFTFEARDKRHAQEILDNLNTGSVWEEDPNPELATVLLVGGPLDGENVQLPPAAENIIKLETGQTIDGYSYALQGDGTALFVSESLEDSDELATSV